MNENLELFSDLDLIRELFERENERISMIKKVDIDAAKAERLKELEAEEEEPIPMEEIVPGISTQQSIADDRPAYPIKCDMCGARSTVPFKPKPDYPVYCRVCFDKRRNR